MLLYVVLGGQGVEKYKIEIGSCGNGFIARRIGKQSRRNTTNDQYDRKRKLQSKS